MKSMIHALYFEKINAQIKKIFALFLFVLFSVTLYAQQMEVTRSGVPIHFGLEITPSIVWLKAENPLPPALDGNGSKVGFGFGLMTEFGFSRNYSFATGIDINYRGGNLKSLMKTAIAGGNPGDSLSTLTTSNYTLEYIEIPLTLKMKTNEIGYLTYFGQIGLAPGINISSKADIQTQTQTVNSSGAGSNTTTSDSNGADVSKAINTFNLSLIVSIGAEYSLGGSTTALAAITFNNGFLNVLSADNYKAISNCLGLTVGVLF